MHTITKKIGRQFCFSRLLPPIDGSIPLKRDCQSNWLKVGMLIIILMVFVNCSSLPSTEELAKPMVADGAGMPNYAITQMQATGKVDNDLVKFTTIINVSVYADGWQSVKIFPSELSVTSYEVLKGKGKNVILDRKKDAYYLLIGSKGDYEINLTHISRIRQEKLGRATPVYFIPAVRSSVKFAIPVKDAKVSVSPEIDFGLIKDKSNITEVLLYNSQFSSVNLSWSTVESAKVTPANYLVEQQDIFSVTKGSLRIDAFFDYTVLQGETDIFEISLAPDLNIISVASRNLRKWDTRDDKGVKILRIETQTPVNSAFSLHLSLEKILEAIPMVFAAPEIIPLGCEREKGYIAVQGKKDLRLEPVSLENVSQIDLQDLPAGEKSIAGEPLSLAFKYLKRPFQLNLKVDNVLPKVFAEINSVARISKDAIRMDTVINYTIRDAGVFALKLKLDEGLRIINVDGLNINNWYLKENILTIDLRSKAEGAYQLVVLSEKSVKSAESIELPGFQAIDAEREQGYIGLVAFTGLKVDVISFDGISQINVKEFPATESNQPKAENRAAPVRSTSRTSYTGLQNQAQQEEVPEPVPTFLPDIAFRYLKHPFTLKFSVSDIKPEINAEVRTLIKLDERKVNLSYNIAYDIRKSGVFALKVQIPKDLHITNVTGEYMDDWKLAGNELNISLSTRISGNYNLYLETEIIIEKLDKDFTVPVLQVMDIKKEQGFIAVRPNPALRINSDIKTLSKVVEIDIKELPSTMMAQPSPVLAYKYYETPWALKINIEKVKPTVMAETFHLVSIGEAVVHNSITARYQILYAAVSQFKVLIPKDAINIDIRGDNIKHKGEEVTADGRLWTVSLHAPVMNIYNLYVTFQTEMKKEGGGQPAGSPADRGKFAPLGYQGIVVQEVERETGYLVFAARPDMELAPPEIELLTSIDEREIPADYKVGIDLPILLSYRYVKHPYKLVLKVSQNEFSKVLVATIDACRLATTMAENGQLITDIVAQVRNTREQYLRVAFPSEVDIWHVRVAGKQVSCFTTQEKGQPVTLIPIAQESKTDTPFIVNIRYAGKMKALSSTGSLDLKCPQVNIPIMRLGWSVSVPKNYSLSSMAGNMEPVTSFEQGLQPLDPERIAVSQQQTVNWNSNTNQPQQSVSNVTQQKQMAQMNDQEVQNYEALENIKRAGSAKLAGAPTLYTGRRPETGKTYNFQTLISLDLIGEIKAHYVKDTMGVTFLGFLIIIIALFALWFWSKVAISPRNKVAAMVALILILIGLHTLMPYTYDDSFKYAIGTLVVVNIAVALLAGFKVMQVSITKSKSQSADSPADRGKEDDEPAEPTPPAETPATT